jgi:hypothetical protein
MGVLATMLASATKAPFSLHSENCGNGGGQGSRQSTSLVIASI